MGWSGRRDARTVFKFLGFVPLATGLMGWCPLYAIGKLSTRAKETVAAR
jgi:hypothetical protein